jgi:hypothetical protein
MKRKRINIRNPNFTKDKREKAQNKNQFPREPPKAANEK